MYRLPSRFDVTMNLPNENTVCEAVLLKFVPFKFESRLPYKRILSISITDFTFATSFTFYNKYDKIKNPNYIIEILTAKIALLIM